MENKFSRLRLGGRRDFQKIQHSGRTFRINEWLILSFLKKNAGQIRVGWTVPGYVGNAVIRNRMKRWLRESLRSQLSKYQNISMDVNLVFLNRGPVFYRGLSHEKVNQSIVYAINKLKSTATGRT